MTPINSTFSETCAFIEDAVPVTQKSFLSEVAPYGANLFNNMMTIRGMHAVQGLLPGKLAKAYSYVKYPLYMFGGPTVQSAMAAVGTIDFAASTGIRLFQNYLFGNALDNIQF